MYSGGPVHGSRQRKVHFCPQINSCVRFHYNRTRRIIKKYTRDCQQQLIININYHICIIKVVYNEYGHTISNLVLEYQEIRIS